MIKECEIPIKDGFAFILPSKKRKEGEKMNPWRESPEVDNHSTSFLFFVYQSYE